MVSLRRKIGFCGWGGVMGIIHTGFTFEIFLASFPPVDLTAPPVHPNCFQYKGRFHMRRHSEIAYFQHAKFFLCTLIFQVQKGKGFESNAFISLRLSIPSFYSDSQYSRFISHKVYTHSLASFLCALFSSSLILFISVQADINNKHAYPKARCPGGRSEPQPPARWAH
ncbi:hypothetical protein N431DRAFT_211901 [Stipitochalara longipes BDJ]|nr:hypothetical protein N431DRAFT_211901 [Stipitochalara longipes BDJ]